MKIAIATDGDNVSGHFGHCQTYTIFTVENGVITLRETLINPGHEPGKLPALLAGHKATHVIAGGMGPKAIDLFCASNIDVIIGVAGPVETVIRDFIEGNITPGESCCHHGESGHECGGH